MRPDYFFHIISIMSLRERNLFANNPGFFVLPDTSEFLRKDGCLSHRRLTGKTAGIYTKNLIIN